MIATLGATNRTQATSPATPVTTRATLATVDLVPGSRGPRPTPHPETLLHVSLGIVRVQVMQLKPKNQQGHKRLTPRSVGGDWSPSLWPSMSSGGFDYDCGVDKGYIFPGASWHCSWGGGLETEQTLSELRNEDVVVQDENSSDDEVGATT